MISFQRTPPVLPLYVVFYLIATASILSHRQGASRYLIYVCQKGNNSYSSTRLVPLIRIAFLVRII
jgi:hypothetical protein